MKVVYVSGKYRDTCHYNVLKNIEAAREAALKFWRRGYAVIAPHLNTAFLDGACEDSVWLEGDLEFVRRCDVVVMLPNYVTSEGAKAELALALELGKEIIFET